jgi:predicted methyltransferase
MYHPLRSIRQWAALSTLLLGYHLPLNAAAPVAATGADRELTAVLNGAWRAEANRARDRYRHPAETLAFFQVSPADTLIEITPGSGWYAEILAPLLREHGKYYAAIVDPAKLPEQQREYQARARSKLTEKFQADRERYGAATIIEFDPAAPVFGKPNSADRVLTFRNVHNWVKAGTAAGYFRAFYQVLKPGGVLGIEDHRANAGSPLDVNSGYLTEEYVIKLATEAGFKLADRSEINANPADSKDYPKGVWTLPPTLVLGDVDKEKYLAIGESDRLTLRFTKPAAR